MIGVRTTTHETIILNPDQDKEFHDILLKEFAQNYLIFLKSSPVNTKRKLYKYFQPVPDDELSDHDILYGPDRDQAYKDLITSFELCKSMHAFDDFFKDKNIYWQSESIPRLIIFKEWLA